MLTKTQEAALERLGADIEHGDMPMMRDYETVCDAIAAAEELHERVRDLATAFSKRGNYTAASEVLALLGEPPTGHVLDEADAPGRAAND